MASALLNNTQSLGSPLGKLTAASVKVPDIRCAACALKIERDLITLPGIERCRTSLATKTVVVDYSGISVESILEKLEELGFTPTLDTKGEAQEMLDRDAKSMLSKLGVAGIGTMQVMMFALVGYVSGPDGIEPAYKQLMAWASLAMATPVALYSALPFHKAALRDLRRFSLGMDVPVSLAISAAYLFSAVSVFLSGEEVYFDSVCMFTFFLLIGRFLELSSRRKYQDGVDISEACLPPHAKLAESGEIVAIENIRIGDRVLVAVNERISVDGFVVEGVSSVSEMAFTGESLPVTKKVGSRVLAGSENLDGELVIEAKESVENFVIKKIADLFTESSLYKPKFSILADRIARYFVLTILLLAFSAGTYWYLAGASNWFAIALTVMVVSCPCALSLATPVAYTVAITALKNFGIVITTGEFLEKVAKVEDIVFDKTGTLTTGNLSIAEVVNIKDQDNVLPLCMALEKVSSHPIARAFEVDTDYIVSDSLYEIGEGVEGYIDGVHYRLGKPGYVGFPDIEIPGTTGVWILLADTSPIAWVNLSDTLRTDAGASINNLKALYSVSMLTGDSSNEATRVASELGIEDFIAGATPESKVARIKEMQDRGQNVLMVGDGINDAAAMGVAYTSLAISPVDIVVQEAAEASLLQSELGKLSTLLQFSKRVQRVIQQNISWALIYNIVVIPLAVSGVLEPWMAALGMSLSSLFVVLNANRLRLVSEA